MTVPQIEDYRFGQIKVDGRVYTHDLIIGPETMFPDWRRDEGHRLSLEDLTWALDAKPEVLIIGTGSLGRMRVPQGALERLRDIGIEVITQHTGMACETYNRLRERQRVVAVLHLTC